jgi:excisionase family DNA binding protein
MNTTSDDHEFLTDAGLAEFLRVSVRSVERMNTRGDLPAPVAVGRSRRWNKAAVLQYLQHRQGGDAQEAGH